MTPRDPQEVTRLLLEARGGDSEAMRKLFPLVYQDLLGLARRQLRDTPPGGTLQPTVLIHELYLRLADRTALDVRDRAHFFALAARVMRQLLVDDHRRRKASKRGGSWIRLSLEGVEAPLAEPAVDVLALEEALEELARLDERKARVVELRFFGGLTIEDAAAALDVSPSTVEADWHLARAWLKRALER